MSKKIHVTNRTRNLIIVVAACLLAALAVAGLIITAELIGKPFPGFWVRSNGVVGGISSSRSGKASSEGSRRETFCGRLRAGRGHRTMNCCVPSGRAARGH